jgi:hypothetical protein
MLFTCVILFNYVYKHNVFITLFNKTNYYRCYAIKAITGVNLSPRGPKMCNDKMVQTRKKYLILFISGPSH